MSGLKLIGLAGRKRSGKDTTGKFIREAFAGEDTVVRLFAFANPIRDGLRAMFDVDLSEPLDREAPLFAGRSYRHLGQTLGTEWGRQLVHPDVWLLVMQQRLAGFHNEMFALKEPGLAVITDVRFPNEAQLIHELGGEVWQIDNPNLPPPTDTHLSEMPLPDEMVDQVIVNSGTLEDLRHRVGHGLFKSGILT